jgi:hypothetical protein
MNFQSVSTAEKLPSSGGQPGGYMADGVTPGPVLSRALDFVDSKVAAMMGALHSRHLDGNTVVILSAKHGQSPDTPSALTRIPDGPIIDALNAAWKSAHPQASAPLVAFSIDDDAMVIWLNDHSREAADFAKRFLLDHSGTGNDINGNPKAYTSSGLARVYAGRATSRFFGAERGDARVPDLYGVTQYGTVYTGGHGKIAEHGGANPQDRDVPLLVSGEPIRTHMVVSDRVETTQIAPTILNLLGLRADALQAVRIEGTRALPGVASARRP